MPFILVFTFPFFFFFIFSYLCSIFSGSTWGNGKLVIHFRWFSSSFYLSYSSGANVLHLHNTILTTLIFYVLVDRKQNLSIGLYVSLSCTLLI